MIQNKQEVNI